MSDPIRFEDFILPLIINSADDYKPRQVKEKFERLAFLLAKQAFWLQIFELLKKRESYVEAIEFTRAHYAASMMKVIAKPGADPVKISGAHKELSKARGKFGSGNWHSMVRHIHDVTGANGMVRLADQETILHRALGEDLYGLRKSSIESEELSLEMSDAAIGALSGRARSNRL